MFFSLKKMGSQSSNPGIHPGYDAAILACDIGVASIDWSMVQRGILHSHVISCHVVVMMCFAG